MIWTSAAKLRTYLLRAEEQIAILRHIARQTLGFAQLSEKPRAAELATLEEAAIRIHQRVIESKQIHLLTDIPEGAVAEVFSGELLQVVSNLIVNDLDALPSEGILWVRVRRRKSEVDVVIADSGHGIST